MSTSAMPLAQPKWRIDADTRFEAIDFVNRVNFLFDRWQPEELLAAFSDDVIVDHPLGRSAGKEELAAFLKGYEPITQGVRRHNCNHVIDAGPGDDIIVTYYILLSASLHRARQANSSPRLWKSWNTTSICQS